MTAKILSGREVADSIKQKVAEEVKNWKQNTDFARVWSPSASAKTRLPPSMSETR